MTRKMENSTEHDVRFEEAMRQALRRQPAPDGLEGQILVRVAEQARANRTPHGVGGPAPAVLAFFRTFFRQPLTRWATAIGLAIALISGGLEYRNLQRERRERAQGEAAKQQLMLALRIAGSKLQMAKSKVNESSADADRILRLKN